MLPLFIPWLLVLLLLVDFLFLFKKKRLIAFLVFVVVILLNLWSECIPLRLFAKTSNNSDEHLKVMCFNIDGIKDGAENRIPDIARLIIQQKPDVLFVTEYRETDHFLLDSLLNEDLPYSSYTSKTGNGFYSKYPITPLVVLNNNECDSGVFSTKVSFGEKCFNIYGCHLSSNNFTTNNDYLHPNSIKTHKDCITYFKDIRRASKTRIQESSVLIDDVNDKRPTIVMGDFNDVGGSSAIHIIEKAGLKDAWWQGGCGYGATVHSPLPYRIDHIFYSEEIELKYVNIIGSNRLSDHDALVAVFSF